MNGSEISGLAESCCRIGFASIKQYDQKEQKAVRTLMPNVETVIVVAHHITHSLEWVWFKYASERTGEICPADMHLRAVVEKISNKLVSEGYESVVPVYPGISGVMFKTLAVKTGLGELGRNFLFMNADWGPWIHLRAVFTNAQVEYERPVIEQSCNDCGKCIGVCPSGAIMESDFNGLRCRAKMREIRDSLIDVPYIFECEKCLRVCPIGEQPREVVVSYKKNS